MLIAKQTITSYLKGKEVYAMKGDKLFLLWQSGEVGCYRNEETGFTFPTKILNTQEVPDDVIITREREVIEESKRGGKKKVNTNINQISMF